MVSIRQDFISWRYLVKCPTNAIALHIAQLVCYCKKANLCSLLDSRRQIPYWLTLTMPTPRVQPWVRGRSAGSFPEQWLVIEPTALRGYKSLDISRTTCYVTVSVALKMELLLKTASNLKLVNLLLSESVNDCNYTWIYERYVWTGKKDMNRPCARCWCTVTNHWQMSDFYSNIFCYGLNVNEKNRSHRFSVISACGVVVWISSLLPG